MKALHPLWPIKQQSHCHYHCNPNPNWTIVIDTEGIVGTKSYPELKDKLFLFLLRATSLFSYPILLLQLYSLLVRKTFQSIGVLLQVPLCLLGFFSADNRHSCETQSYALSYFPSRFSSIVSLLLVSSLVQRFPKCYLLGANFTLFLLWRVFATYGHVSAPTRSLTASLPHMENFHPAS
jgi:hypothetical protein